MDIPTLVLIVFSTNLYLILYQLVKLGFRKLGFRKNATTKLLPLPPGPKPLPLIGNVLMLGPRPHRSFANLANVHGPLISIRLGSVATIIVSSSEVAKEMFLKNDQALSSNRTIPNSVTAGDHHKLTMSWLPVTSPKWRNFRKITTFHLLSPQRLNACSSFRQAKVKQLFEYVLECSRTNQPVDIGKAAFTTSLNLLSRLFFSLELANHSSNESREFKDLIWKIMEDIGKPNIADYFPCLKYFDPFGIRRRLAANFDKLIAVFQGIIGERMSSLTSNNTHNDVLDVLLELYRQNELSMDEINHLLVDIFDAGTDTTSNTFEWAMAELIKNPNMMEKAQTEIKQVLGKDSHNIQESDIPKLPYLQAIIKETLRLHPPTVFLLPRKAETDVQLYGYTVPENAQILVNLWAIGRDPKVWKNPDVFSPERFVGNDIEVKGRDFELLPFGAGRRICPGMNLAYRMLMLMLATLLQSFDWKLPDGMNPKDLDMDEKFGIALQKTKPLQIIPIFKD